MNTTKTHKEALLLAGSDMGKGKEGVVLSTHRFFNSTNGVADGRYSVLRKKGEISATSISEGAMGRYGSSNRGSKSLETSIFEEETMGTRTCRSYSERDGLKLHSYGPGLGEYNLPRV